MGSSRPRTDQEIDLATGLPKLGPRQFWRVMYYASSNVYGSGHYVCLMELRPTPLRPERAVEIAEEQVQLNEDESRNAEKIRDAAEKILTRLRGDRVVKGMLGDYPPKRL